MQLWFDCAATSQTSQFVGYTDKFILDYDRSNKDSTVTVTCLDPLGMCAFGAIPAGTTPLIADGVQEVTPQTWFGAWYQD